jgi:hypothetical protein
MLTAEGTNRYLHRLTKGLRYLADLCKDSLAICRPTPVPEIIDPVFAKTSQNARFLLSENERFGLVFVKTGSINSGTGRFFSKIRFWCSPSGIEDDSSAQSPGIVKIWTENYLICIFLRWYLDSIRLHVKLLSRSKTFFYCLKGQ